MAIFYIEILNAASIKSFLNAFYVKNKHNNYIINIKINLINIIVTLYKAIVTIRIVITKILK